MPKGRTKVGWWRARTGLHDWTPRECGAHLEGRARLERGHAPSGRRENEMELKRTLGRHALGVAGSVLTVLLFAAPLTAQETRGKITGRVTDTSKGAIPGAAVTVKDVARGTTSSITTNAEGLFQANYLLPGMYEIAVELTGFKKFVQSDVRVQVAETRNINVVLQVGGLEEVVMVTSERLTVNTSDANLGLTVDQQRLEDLPLIHGDPYKIMGLATGLAHSGSQRLDRPYEPTHIVGFAMNGTRGNRSDLLIDGVPSTSTANANEVIATYVPPSDLVQEFKVQTATFDSQFGNTEGGVTSIAIKAGTNAYHGSVYFFAEPWKLAANDFFGNSRSQKRPETKSTRPGVTISGPVRIPGLYDGRDKTFFTFGFESITDERPRFDAGQSVWVPTEKLRNGDFSDYLNNIKIYDPLTRVPSGTAGQYTGTPFAGNIIPPERISPVAKAVLGYYSLPKQPGLAGNIYDSELLEKAAYDSTTVRLDQKISGSNRMFVRGSYYKRDSHYNDYMGNGLTSTNFQFISYQAMVDDVHVINPSTVLNVRYGYNRFERNAGQEAQYVSNFDLTDLAFPASYNDFVPADDRRYPRIEFPQTLGTAFGNDFRPTTSHTAAATLTKTLSSHAIKGGMEMRIYREDSLPTGNANSGRYVFNNNFTRQNSGSGTDYEGLQGYAAFLLGLPSTLEIQRLADYSEYSKTWGFFVQDDWRVSSKLTLNLGLRYELETALTERNDKSVSGFDYEYTQPIEGTVQARYAALNDPALKALLPSLAVKGGLMYAGVDTPSRLYETPKNTFLPRVGFAYQINDKTVIRGGAGLFAGFLGQRRGDVIVNPGWSQTTTIPDTKNAAGAPIPQSWDNGLLTQPILEPVGNSKGRQAGLGTSVTFFNQDPQISKQLRYQIGFQRELPLNTIFEALFLGNYGYDIEINRNINALPNEYLSTSTSRDAAMTATNSFLTATVTNPFAGLLPGTSFNSATIARSQLLRPYPQFGDITTTNNEGKSWYNSAQVSIQKRFSKGNTIGISYTYSRWEQATEYLNPADPTPTRMISDLDVPHRLSASAIFELPFGKGRKFGTNASGLLDVLIGGWQVQGVYTYQTGFPLQFATINASSGAVTPAAFYNGGKIALDNPTVGKWFDTSAFTNIVDGATSTNATPVSWLRPSSFPLRFDDVRADAINNIDFSLLKDIAIKNDVRLQLRAEFTNGFNHPYLATGNGQIVVNPTNANFGKISASNQQNYARRAQFGVKLLF